jgi:hypothetical protein
MGMDLSEEQVTTLLGAISSYIFFGVPSNAAWDIIKLAWEKANEKDWEEIYLEAFQAAVAEMRPSLARYADGDIGLDEKSLRQALHRDLQAAVDVTSVGDLTAEEFTKRLAGALCERQALTIGGHNLSEPDYAQLTRNLVQQAISLFKKLVIKNESAFRKAILAEVMGNEELTRSIGAFLSSRFELTLGNLHIIEQKLDDQSEKLDQIEQAIKQHLGLDRPREIIIQEIQAAIETAPRGPMFEVGGLCDGYLLQPLPDRYFVAQEFSPDREDLRQTLAEALTDFGLQPICADDFYWPGSILCKICALIQDTPLGVYQLTVSQNRNVYLELGIAVGLGRPFLLVKEREAEVAPLVEGLEYFPVDSYLELRYELGPRVSRFMAGISNYRPPSRPSVGSERTAVIAHGDLDVVDFCVSVAKTITEYKLQPVILGDPTGKLARFLEQEGVPYHIIGSVGRTRLDETAAAIRAARLGVYRIDKETSPDAFLALGISMGLNRPGLLVHKSNRNPPSDLRGLSALAFGPYAGDGGLRQLFGRQFGPLLHRHSQP